MPRLARFIPENSYFHILSRGNNRQDVFLEDKDFNVFLSFLKECLKRFSWKLYHYVLMTNHYHLILYNQIPKNLSEGVKLLNLKYVQYFRKKYGGVGHLWQDRFKSFIIEDGKYILECGRYIELNPVRAGIVNKPEDYRWSSCHYYFTGIQSDLVSPSPEYLGLSDRRENREKLYIQFISDRVKEKRNLERYFRKGFYGSEGFGLRLKSKGLKERGWKRGKGSIIYKHNTNKTFSN